MINFTHVKTPHFPFRIQYSESALSLGSCFSVNIGDKLSQLKYKIHQNPSGITFNPASLSSTVKMLKSSDSLHATPSQCHNDLWSHPDFHSSFNHPSKAQHQQLINESLDSARHFIKNVSVVMITLGTAYVFRSRTTGRLVNNCHKQPAAQFDQQLMTVSEIKTALEEITQTIDNLSNNEVQYLISVSPVRHIKNGLVEDRHSKSLLLVATHAFVKGNTRAHYFPAYEIMTDELRDYRYYADDLIHPSQPAIDSIFALFEKTLLDENEADVRKVVNHLVNRENHRALFPESAAHQRFLAQLEKDRQRIREKYPFLNRND